MLTYDITVDHAGKRIDQCLADTHLEHSRGVFVRAIKKGTILVGGKPVKPSYKVKVGDVITMEEIQVTSDTLVPNTDVSLNIVAETEDFIVINKPRGIQIHPSHAEKVTTIANGLLAYYPPIATVGDEGDGPQMRPGIMSRLDKYTSGLMVVAKNQKTFDALKSAFANRTVKKMYHALVWGEPKELTGTINMPIGRAVSYTKQKVAFGKFTTDAKEAVTDYRTLKTYDVSNLLIVRNPGDHPAEISHLEIHPQTGRMHQIRVHLAHIGRGIIGDIKYERKNEKLLNKRLFSYLEKHVPDDYQTFYLHAKELSFTLDEKNYTFECALPDHFQFLLERM